VGDGNGNTAYSTNTIVVEDKTAPEITILGSNPLTNECHSAFSDPGATANDAGAGPVSVTTTGSVDANLPGTYTLTYTADDGHGNTNTATRTVHVVDSLAPVISWSFTNLVLSADTNCQAFMPDVTGTNYILASDACAGANMVITQSPTNEATLSLGTNEVVIAVGDGNGNTAYSTNTIVVEDKTAPEITVLGSNPLTNECHSGFSDPGATALDNCSGVVSVSTNNPVDPNTVGVYAIEYVATDGAGNTATNTRTVQVVDTVAPVVTLNGADPMTVECHSAFSDPGATASDACAGSLGVSVSGSVDANTPGTYVLGYSATDPSGNTGTNSRTVHVVDSLAPVITVLGANPLTNYAHVAFVDPGATANDACAGGVGVVTNGTVNVDVPGTYTLEYVATDPTGNSATNTRTVQVVALVAPVILSEQMTGGSFHLTFSGPEGQPYRVWRSVSLAVPIGGWLELTNGTFGTGTVTFIDVAVTNAHQFYRVGSP
jgi:hypothetical protein